MGNEYFSIKHQRRVDLSAWCFCTVGSSQQTRCQNQDHLWIHNQFHQRIHSSSSNKNKNILQSPKMADIQKLKDPLDALNVSSDLELISYCLYISKSCSYSHLSPKAKKGERIILHKNWKKTFEYIKQLEEYYKIYTEYPFHVSESHERDLQFKSIHLDLKWNLKKIIIILKTINDMICNNSLSNLWAISLFLMTGINSW